MFKNLGGGGTNRRVRAFGLVVASAAAAGMCHDASLGIQLISSARAAGAAQTFELDVNTAPGVRTNAVVLGAHGQLSLDDRAKVSSPISNLGRGATQVGVDSRAQDVFSEPTLTLRDRAQLSGAAIVGGSIIRGNNTLISGGTQTGASFADPDGKTFFVTYPGDTPEVHDLQPGQSFTLVPGKVYGAISVKTNATLFVPPGVFTLGSLDLEPSAKLVLQDTDRISIFVKDSIIWRGVLSTASGKPADWLLGYLGTQSVVLEAAFTGLYVGPNASLAIGSLTKPQPPFSGQFFGKDVEVRPDAVIGLQLSSFIKPQLTGSGHPLTGKGSNGNGGAGGAGGSGGASGSGGAGGSGATGAASTGDCTPAQMPLSFVNPTVGADGVPRFAGISLQTGTPACGPITFCTGSDVGATQISVADINQRLANRNTPTQACPVEFTRSGTDCRLNPASVDHAHSCNADTDCPGFQAGARCIDYCKDDSCVSVGRGCASTYDCVGAASDTLGCDTQEVWQCTDPADTGSSSPGDVSSELPPATPKLTPDQAATLDPYTDLDATGTCNFIHSHKSAQVQNGSQFTPPTGSTQDISTAESKSASVKIPKNSNNWNLFANPTVFHNAKVAHSGLDVFTLDLAAQGSLVAGATIMGHPITALDVQLGAEVTQCGVSASPHFRLFGVNAASFADVTTPDSFTTPCKQAFSDFTTAMGAADSFLVFARQLVTEFNNGQYTAVCVDVRDKLGLDPTFDCSDGPNAKARAEQLANFVVNKYLNLGQALSTARSFALQKAAAAAAQVSTPSDVGIGSDFSELGLDQSIPIGPIAVEIAVSLYGNWFLKGGIAPTLSLGAQGQGDPQIGASAHVTPGISVSASVYVGVGIDLGVAGATVGLEGTLLLVDADAPITASVTAKRTTVAETSVLPGHDYRTSDFGGTQIAGLPAGNAYKWVGTAGLGAAFGLASLNGHIDAAARVHFLFFSKTFRKQIASFTGFPKQYFPIFSVGGAVPLPSPSPQLFPDNLAITGTPDFGVFGETAAYPQIPLVGGGSIGTLPSNASSTVICPIVVP